jgi:transposase
VTTPRLGPFQAGLEAIDRSDPVGTVDRFEAGEKKAERVAYGYRDDDYFFLKIRSAFPGIPA